MKHLGAGHAEYLRVLAQEIGLSLSDDQARLMLAHLDWVLEWNSRVNLTSIVDPAEAVRLHLVDSLLAVADVEACASGPACDVGAGAGFPGVPLSITTGRAFTMVESVKKKAAVIQGFLDSEAHALGGRITVQALRAEELAVSRPESFAVVTARAVSQLGSLIELASPLLVDGGSLIALKGQIDDSEWEYAHRVAALTGMAIGQISALRLPRVGEVRTIVTVTKVGRSTFRLPRRTGLAQKSLLAPASRDLGTHL